MRPALLAASGASVIVAALLVPAALERSATPPDINFLSHFDIFCPGRPRVVAYASYGSERWSGVVRRYYFEDGTTALLPEGECYGFGGWDGHFQAWDFDYRRMK